MRDRLGGFGGGRVCVREIERERERERKRARERERGRERRRERERGRENEYLMENIVRIHMLSYTLLKVSNLVCGFGVCIF